MREVTFVEKITRKVESEKKEEVEGEKKEEVVKYGWQKKEQGIKVLRVVVSGSNAFRGNMKVVRETIKIVFGWCEESEWRKGRKVDEVEVAYIERDGFEKEAIKIIQEIYKAGSYSFALNFDPLEYQDTTPLAENLISQRHQYTYHLVLIFVDELFKKYTNIPIYLFQKCVEEWNEAHIIYYGIFRQYDTPFQIETKLSRLFHPLFPEFVK